MKLWICTRDKGALFVPEALRGVDIRGSYAIHETDGRQDLESTDDVLCWNDETAVIVTEDKSLIEWIRASYTVLAEE